MTPKKIQAEIWTQKPPPTLTTSARDRSRNWCLRRCSLEKAWMTELKGQQSLSIHHQTKSYRINDNCWWLGQNAGWKQKEDKWEWLTRTWNPGPWGQMGIIDREKGVETPSVMQICLKLSDQLLEMGLPTGQLTPPPQPCVSSQYLAFWWQLPHRDLNWSKWKALDERSRSLPSVCSLRIQKGLKHGQVRLMGKRIQRTVISFCSFRDWRFGLWCILKPSQWSLEFRIY